MDPQLVDVGLLLPVDLQRDLGTPGLARSFLRDRSGDGAVK